MKTEVEAKIQVKSIESDLRSNVYGFEIVLESQVERKSDGALISKGKRKIWLPDYGQYDC